MKKHLVLLTGNLGVGKTSLAEGVGQRMGWYIGHESVADNPYLADFYQDMPTWSFHLQIFFLGHRIEQHLAATAAPQPAILDRSIYEDAYIFAKALHTKGNITDRDYQAYLKVFQYIEKTLAPPTLLVYLKAPMDVLLQRIKKRGLGIDHNLSKEYLEMIDCFYEQWLAEFSVCPVLRIDTESLDYVNNRDDLDAVIQLIQEKLP